MTDKATRTATRAEATAARIIDAARTLFLERPYADVTTEMIVRAAKVTKGALYHHFQSKEALYSSMMLDDLERKRRLFEEAVALDGTCRERLGRLTGDFFRLPEEERELIRLVRRDINTFSGKERNRMVRAYQKALPAQVEQIVSDGIADGELEAADARLLSWSYVALVEVMMNEYADDVLGSTQARLEHVLGIFFEGVGADRVEVPA